MWCGGVGMGDLEMRVRWGTKRVTVDSPGDLWAC